MLPGREERAGLFAGLCFPYSPYGREVGVCVSISTACVWSAGMAEAGVGRVTDMDRFFNQAAPT